MASKTVTRSIKYKGNRRRLYFLKYERVFQILNYYISIFVGDTPFALNVKLGTELTTRAVVNQQEAKPRLDFNPKSIEYRLVEKIYFNEEMFYEKMLKRAFQCL